MLGNWLKTSILMAAIMALFGLIGGYVGGASGMMMALLFGGAMNLFAYWFSDSMVLKMYNAQEVDEASAPQFYAMVRELAQRADLPMPRVYLIDEAQPNAFATGRNPDHAAVAATTGILQLLSAREIRGVMAHELAHVRHRDILISTISATMAGAISALANFAMFFGGARRERSPGQSDRQHRGGSAGANRCVADPDGDFALARVRGRPRRRRDLRRPAGACRWPGENRRLRARHPAADRRSEPGDGADDDHESAVRRWHRQPVLDPPVDRGTRRAAAGHGARRLVEGSKRLTATGTTNTTKVMFIERPVSLPISANKTGRR